MQKNHALCLLAAVMLMAAGCHQQGQRKQTIQQTYQQQVQAIQNNPHMPPQAKAMALGQLKAHDSVANMQGQGNSK